MFIFKESTASQSVLLGPFVDPTDGSVETALTINNTDIRISKAGANIVAKNSGGGTHDELGMYTATFDATDTNTVGQIQIMIDHASALPVYHNGYVFEAAIYDALFASAATGFDASGRVDVGSWLGTAVTLGSGAPDVNIQSIDANAITATSINADAITAAKVADGTIDAATFAAGAIDAAAIATGAIDADALATDAVTEIRSVVNGTADSGSTTTMVDAARTEADTDYWKGSWILFTSGTISGQCRLITGFTPASDTITFAPVTTQAVSTHTYEILPAGSVNVQQWLGSTVNALVAGAVDADVSAIQANVITASAIASAAITAAKFGAGAIDATAIANGAIDAATFAAGAIDAAAIATGAIDADAIAGDAITAAKIADGAIDAATFAAGAIDAAAIATDAITSNELAASAAQKIRDEILPTQNAAFNNLKFLWVAASDHVTPVTAASGTSVTRSIDGGAFGAGTGTLAEIGNGIYQYDASAADMNGGVICFRFVATGGTPGAPDDAFVTIVTGGGV